MTPKIHEIIAAAEKGANEAPLGELQHVYELIRDLGLHNSNVRTHVKRLGLKVSGATEQWGGE